MLRVQGSFDTTWVSFAGMCGSFVSHLRDKDSYVCETETLFIDIDIDIDIDVDIDVNIDSLPATCVTR